MHTSKTIARALSSALNRGEDPIKLGDMLLDTFKDTSRETQLRNVLFYLEEFAKKQEDSTVCRIESATELPKETVAAIKEIFEAEETKVRINKDLIGGFKVEHRGLLYDATVAARLASLKEALV